MLQGEDDRVCAIVDGRFLKDRADVVLDSLVTDHQAASNLLVAESASYMIKDFNLPYRERGDRAGRFIQAAAQFSEFAKILAATGARVRTASSIGYSPLAPRRIASSNTLPSTRSGR